MLRLSTFISPHSTRLVNEARSELPGHKALKVSHSVCHWEIRECSNTLECVINRH